ncbi:MAG: hypothetical protein GF308_08555 [Candidatus Heimdallarchaeota archaeon]|nr:hypothetical protein [Candidatus Heimdallarchaeota archaeon]
MDLANAKIFLLWIPQIFLNNSLFCCSPSIRTKISQEQTIGLPEPSLSGSIMKLLSANQAFHKTSKKAFNVYYKSNESRLFVVKSILVLIINLYIPKFALGIKNIKLLNRRSGNHE